MSRQLARFLARAGRGATRQSEWGRLRFAALVVGSTALAVAAVLSTLTVGLARDRETTMRSLLPVMAGEDQQATSLYHFRLANIRDEDGLVQQFTVISITPLTPDAALPPGVDEWPAPGEAVVSPAALKGLAGHPNDLFGEVTGTISSDGLEAPGERRIYRRPSELALDEAAMTPVLGYGGPNGAEGFWGTPTLYAHHLWVLLSILVFLLVVPAVVAVAAGAGVGAEGRQRRSRQMIAMGADRIHLAVVDISEAWSALAVGSLLGSVVMVGFATIDLDVRYLDISWLAADARRLWPACTVAILLAHILSLIVLLGVRLRQWSRPSSHAPNIAQAVPYRRALLCVAAGLAALWLPALSSMGAWRTMSYNAAVVVVVLSLSAVAAVALAGLGQLAVRFGRRGGSPGAMLAGRRLALFPVRTARLLSGVTGAVLLFGQVQLYASTLGDMYQQAVVARSTFGDLVASAGHIDASAPGVTAFLGDLPQDVEPVWTWTSSSSAADHGHSEAGVPDETYHLAGSCSALTALGVACQQGETQLGSSPDKVLSAVAFSAGLLGDEVVIEPYENDDPDHLDEHEAELSLISTSGMDLPVDELQRRANRYVVDGMELGSVGDQFLAAGTNALRDQRWVIFWGLIGLVPLVIAAAIVLAADTYTSARETAPLAALFDRRRWLAVVSLGRVWLPMTLAGVLGSLSYLLLPRSMSVETTRGAFFNPSPGYAVASALLCTLLGLVLSVSSYRATARSAGTWAP